jgi:hypothetical protein
MAANLKSRLVALEQAHGASLEIVRVSYILDMDGELNAGQLAQINEAKAQGRRVVFPSGYILCPAQAESMEAWAAQVAADKAAMDEADKAAYGD